MRRILPGERFALGMLFALAFLLVGWLIKNESKQGIEQAHYTTERTMKARSQTVGGSPAQEPLRLGGFGLLPYLHD